MRLVPASFRLRPETVQKLQEYAQRKKTSTARIAQDIFDFYEESGKVIHEEKWIGLSKKLANFFFQSLDEQRAKKYSELAISEVRRLHEMYYHGLASFDAFLKIDEAAHKQMGAIYSVKLHNGKMSYIVHHNLGINYSKIQAIIVRHFAEESSIAVEKNQAGEDTLHMVLDMSQSSTEKKD